MTRTLAAAFLALASSALAAAPLAAEAPPLLPRASALALAEELSGEAAKRNLEGLSRQHRMRGSRGYLAAAELVAGELRRFGLADAEIVSIPADGETFYGTQRSRRPWDADFAELWELRREGETWTRARRLASWEAMPLSLAQDSESGEVEAELVDVGPGTAPEHYAGRDVRGKLVLVSSQPEAVVALAIERFGAAGIVSYAQNQRTAWWGDDATLVRWGHVGSFNATPSFAFMVSLGTARELQARLARGEAVRLHAVVRAGQHEGAYHVVTATIPGADAALREQEIVFSCHLDHPRPGANDNASGCATILEVARALSTLVEGGRLPRPARTLRFVFPPEVEGTLAVLHHRPEIARRARAAIHLDMVGGGPATKAVFHVTRGPASLPSFVHDVAAALGAWANRETGAFAASGRAEFPLVAAEGGKEPLQADLADYTGGSDHDVWNDSSFRVPAIYFNDWPDRYIHTTGDTAANIDPTKLERAAFLAAASALVLADLDAARAAELRSLLRAAGLRRLAEVLERRTEQPDEAGALARFWSWHEQAVHESLEWIPGGDAAEETAAWLREWRALLGGIAPPAPPAGDAALIFRRRPEPRGPMSAFGYHWLEAQLGREAHGRLALLDVPQRWGGGDYAYEALNLVDGNRSAQEIRDALTAIYGSVPLAAVVEYLRALETAGVLERAR